MTYNPKALRPPMNLKGTDVHTDCWRLVRDDQPDVILSGPNEPLRVGFTVGPTSVSPIYRLPKEKYMDASKLILSCYKCKAGAFFKGPTANFDAYDAGWRLDMKRGQMCPECADKRAHAYARKMKARRWQG